mmetsp:Transcript_17412/g.23956  ORF Transcript_17412/g.23956 Transcript_17412/m.23956 type:complete len:86 (-) Transcript_17412:729-986(-)
MIYQPKQTLAPMESFRAQLLSFDDALLEFNAVPFSEGLRRIVFATMIMRSAVVPSSLLRTSHSREAHRRHHGTLYFRCWSVTSCC